MSVWTPLRAELRGWRAEGLHLPIWWRDDDAVAATPALERLVALSARIGVPVHLAVIPDRLASSLAPVVARTDTLIPCVHGWRHISHAPEGAKKAEFGHPRPDAAPQAAAALRVLRATFGTGLRAMFVPPWNRIDTALMPQLTTAGYTAVSTFGPRHALEAAPGLTQINTHIDPIDWRGTRGVVAPTLLVSRLVANLRARRTGHADPAEPLGLLTHHLVHDEAIWAFSERCLAELLDGGAKVTQV